MAHLITNSAQRIEDLSDLRLLAEPKVLSTNNCACSEACDRIWGVLNSQNERTTFRVHPFPEGLNGERCSIREYDCAYVQANFTEFYEWRNKSSDEVSQSNPFCQFCPKEEFWAYCDYKEVQEVVNVSACRDIFSWDMLASSDHDMGCFSDSKIWIGSKGAHTALHYDTYGVNMVFQVRGNKLWKLWKPSNSDGAIVTGMWPTRLPYEESSVFSRWDIRGRSNQLALGRPDFEVTLMPGQSLFVPKGWWHDVECDSEVCVSLNTWLPTEKTELKSVLSSKKRGRDERCDESKGKCTDSDSFSRVSEAIARVVVSLLLSDGGPNEHDIDGADNDGGGGGGHQKGSGRGEGNAVPSNWINPTESIFSPQENLMLLQSAVHEWVKEERGESSADSSIGSLGRLDPPELLHGLIDALLHPSALTTATKRLLFDISNTEKSGL